MPTFPARHGENPDPSALINDPEGTSTDDAAPLNTIVPSAGVSQVALPVSFCNLPAWHCLQLPPSILLYFPTWHCTHLELARSVESKPIGHSRHVVEFFWSLNV